MSITIKKSITILLQIKNHNDSYRLHREQAPPNIAEGPSHKLSSVAYQDRDGRRTAHPPKYLAPETINGSVIYMYQAYLPLVVPVPLWGL